jgi:hypothetical protein
MAMAGNSLKGTSVMGFYRLSTSQHYSASCVGVPAISRDAIRDDAYTRLASIVNVCSCSPLVRIDDNGLF